MSSNKAPVRSPLQSQPPTVIHTESRTGDSAVSSDTKGNKQRSSAGSSGNVTWSVMIYWIFPVLVVAIVSRFSVDSGPSFLPSSKTSIPLKSPTVAPLGGARTTAPSYTPPPSAPYSSPTSQPSGKNVTPNSNRGSSAEYLANKPIDYQEVSDSSRCRRSNCLLSGHLS